MKISLSTLFLLAGLLVAGPALADRVYQWTDEEGVTHFGAQPPAGVEAKEIRPRTGRSEPVDYGSSDEDQGPPPSLEGAEAYMPNPERCATARANLETLQRATRIRMTDDDGEAYFLDDDARQRQIEEMQRVIEMDC